jgi:hypothetical protein
VPPSQAPLHIGRTIEDLVVGACGFVTSLLTGLILFIVAQKTGFAFYTYMYWFVIPAGAGLSGFAGASGYYAGARFFGHKPSVIFLLNVVAASLATFFLIHYLSYLTLAVDGKQVSNYIPFTQYLDLAIRSTNMRFRVGSTGELGSAGYVVALLQVVGFGVGGFAVYVYLTEQPYCERCTRYMSKKGTSTRYTGQYTGDVETFQSSVTRVIQHLSSGSPGDALEEQRTFGDPECGKANYLRSIINVRVCKECNPTLDEIRG